ncbi:MAG: type 1 glutamine amidotransferase [Nitriliruptorales bacterium]|nr:type 1 glutamine amidotransferase [Nitriliruptorales bacterium]
MKPLACVRHQLTAPLGVIGDVLDGAGVPWRYVDAWRGDAVPAVDDVSGLIVLGGEMNADAVDGHPWLADVRGLLRDAVAQDVPVLGVCLGAQLLARALDAAVLPGAVREIGFRKVDVLPSGDHDPLLRHFAPSSLVFQFHEDTCEPPDGAELLATNDDCAVQAFRAGERAYGVQFHFEVTTAEIRAWCDETPADVLRDVWGTTKDALLAEAALHLQTQQRLGRELTAGFVGLLR